MPKTRNQTKVVVEPPKTSQSSVPGISVTRIRDILSTQRREYQQNGTVDFTASVGDGMSRLEFNHLYVQGVTLKRQNKHAKQDPKGPR